MIDRSAFSYVLMFGALVSCAHASSPERKPKPPAAEPTPSKAAAAPQRAPADGPEPTDPIALELYMPEHFQIITWARDCIINGELELMREPLLALAAHEYRDVVPGAWIEGVGRVQLLAGAAAQAESIAQAANGIAAIANECGQCHRATMEQPLEDPIEALPAQPPLESFRQRMRRHGWALDRMWEGLVLPSENAWVRGAHALANAPAAPPQTEPALPPQARNALEAMRALGAKAAESNDWASRGGVYAELLVGCSACHRGAY